MITIIDNYLTESQLNEIISNVTLSPMRVKESEHPNELGDYTFDIAPEHLQVIMQNMAHYFNTVPDAITINEYLPGQSFYAHIDDETYGEVTAVITVMGNGTMVFEKDGETLTYELSEGSLILFTGEHRWEWTHTVSPVIERRVSLVIRKQI